ncbi:MAG: hypothetical protein J5780_04895 [Treponema sp.]|nr:hypothetical protein [Treponema sp.]
MKEKEAENIKFPKKSLSAFFFALFTAVIPVSAAVPDGNALTEYTEQKLSDAGFNYRREETVSYEEGVFPANITLEFPAAEKNSPDVSDEEKKENRVIFAFTQNFFLNNTALVLDFLSFLKEKKLSYTSEVLISCSSSGIVFNRRSISDSDGTRLFAGKIYNPSLYTAICILQKENDKNLIISGGSSKSSPEQLVSLIAEAFSENDLTPSIPPAFLYRQNVLTAGDDMRTGAFLKEEVPAAGITIDSSSLPVLESLSLKLEQVLPFSSWEKNYTYVPVGKKGFFIGESAFIALFLTASFLILSTICFMSLIKSSSSSAVIKDLKRTFFITPLTLLSTFILFSIVDACFSFLSGYPFLLLGIKLCILLASTFCLYITQLHYNFYVSVHACGARMLITSAVNIFIFSAVNLSFMLIFCVSYIVFLFLSKRHNWKLMAGGFILMFSFTAAVFLRIASYCSWDSFAFFMRPSFLQHFILTFAVCPFQELLFKLTAGFGLIDRGSSSGKRPLHRYAVFTVTAVILFTGLSVFLRFTFFKKNTQTFITNVTAEETEEENFSHSIVSSEYFGMKSNRITIGTDRKVIRYDIRIRCMDEAPVYECNFDFSYTDEHTVRLIVPDYPPANLEAVYTGGITGTETITVDAYFKEGEKYFHESFSIR